MTLIVVNKKLISEHIHENGGKIMHRTSELLIKVVACYKIALN